ncbi:MAG TPA: hypothetical protein VGZ93_05095 [Candidatus Methylacidiphilales bacterium]|jgi:hypothetical protein|nr:hypothetical protein [Candidatus Methylacidiphilales bacterium]
MSAPTPAAQASAPTAPKFCPIEWVKEHAKPYLAPYYLTVAAVLGAITAGFAVVFVLLIIVTANCNVLGWVE